jgi:hypothetical protein
MDKNPFASVSTGRLKLHVRDALPISAEVKTLRGLIESSQNFGRVLDRQLRERIGGTRCRCWTRSQ